MTTRTVTYLLPCAALPRGCASALAIDGPPGIEMLELDLQVPEDKRVHGLITAAGWRLDHGKWVCGNHPFTTPAGPVTVTYWPAAPTPDESEAAKWAVLETALELADEQQTPPGPLPTALPGGEYTPEHRYVWRAYRRAHNLPTVAGEPTTPTAVQVNQAVTWWNQQQASALPKLVVDERVPPGTVALASDSHVIAYNENTGRAAEMRRDEHGQWGAPAPLDLEADNG